MANANERARKALYKIAEANYTVAVAKITDEYQAKDKEIEERYKILYDELRKKEKEEETTNWQAFQEACAPAKAQLKKSKEDAKKQYPIEKDKEA